MRHYKQYYVYTKAIHSDGEWCAKGVILNREVKVTRQLKQFDTISHWMSRDEAKQFAFKLCKLWIDAQTHSHSVDPETVNILRRAALAQHKKRAAT